MLQFKINLPSISFVAKMKVTGNDNKGYRGKIKIINGEEAVSFPCFWGLSAYPRKNSDCIFMSYCVFSDALAYIEHQDAAGFMQEYGYELKEARRVFKACKKTYEKLTAIFDLTDYQFYDICNEFQEVYEDYM